MSGRAFTFRLESVLRLRKHAERRARAEVARELGAASAHSRDLERRTSDLYAAHAGARDAHPSERRLWDAYVDRRTIERCASAEILAEQRARVEESRRRAAGAAQERKAIGRLEERQRAEHASARARAEEAHLGELAIEAFRRGRRGA